MRVAVLFGLWVLSAGRGAVWRQVDGQPDGRLIRGRELDPVATMCGYGQKIARAQGARVRFVRKPQSGTALQQNHPFGMRLVIPEAGRACMAVRNDPFDLNACRIEERGKVLLGRGGIW